MPARIYDDQSYILCVERAVRGSVGEATDYIGELFGGLNQIMSITITDTHEPT